MVTACEQLEIKKSLGSARDENNQSSAHKMGALHGCGVSTKPPDPDKSVLLLVSLAYVRDCATRAELGRKMCCFLSFLSYRRQTNYLVTCNFSVLRLCCNNVDISSVSFQQNEFSQSHVLCNKYDNTIISSYSL